MKKIEKNFFVLLPDSLIKVLRVKMVKDGHINRPLPVGQLMFIGAIVGLSKDKGYCYATNTNKATNSGLSELTTLPVKTISNCRSISMTPAHHILPQPGFHILRILIRSNLMWHFMMDMLTSKTVSGWGITGPSKGTFCSYFNRQSQPMNM